jgi:hypothetical protein
MTAASHPPSTATTGWRHVRNRLRTALLTPVRAMRLRYLPLLMIYYAYGALGLVTIAETFWIKEALTLTPAELASIAVWLTLPWTIKMVFGQLVDSVPILGSERRAYVYIGASLVATGLIVLAGAAGGRIAFAGKNALYVAAQLLIVIGVVLQDVVADAMTTEVVDRKNPDGTPRPSAEVERELGLVQVLGRLALWSGILSVAGLSGWLAQAFSYETVFLLGLIVPAISVTGATLVRLDGATPKPIDWRILGGGLLFGAAVVAIGLGGVPFGQELIFLISVTIIALMLGRVAQDVDEQHRRKILFAALVIFFYRATPGVGEGYRWFTIDVLGFDEAFYGTLAQIGAASASPEHGCSPTSSPASRSRKCCSGSRSSAPSCRCRRSRLRSDGMSGPSRCSASAPAPSPLSTLPQPRPSSSSA